MKREFAMLIKAQAEMGNLPEGGRRLPRSHNKGSSSKSIDEHVYRISDEVVNNESMRTEKDVNIANLLNGQDGDIELELGLENAENVGEMSSTSTPLKTWMKMYKKVGLSISHQNVPTIAGGNTDSPAQVGPGVQPVVKKRAQDSVKGRFCVQSKGKLPKKDLRMHRLVFTEDVLPDGATLHYVVQGKKMLRGFKKGGGIFCTCCDSVVSASQFEIHAGYASRRKPYDNIFTSNGLSLHNLAIDISTNLISNSKQNDYLCSICEYGGDLLCCKTCSRSFHAKCAGLYSGSQETLFCRYCQDIFEKAKLDERSANGITVGRVPGSDQLKEITQRCIHIVETSMPDMGGCAICSCRDFTEKVFDDRTIIICDQCEKEYHVGCLKEKHMGDLKTLPEGDWFCCVQCKIINSNLQTVIKVEELKFWEDVCNNVKMKSEHVFDMNQKLDIQWRLLKGRGATKATRKLLLDAVSIFRNQFNSITDSTTTSLDLIPQLVFGRPFNLYGGMHCAVLMVNSVVVSTAIFRVFGEEIAEIPLIATKSEFEKKGYFQLLFDCTERLLAFLNVKNLVLPAVGGSELYWKDRFGFKKLDLEHVHDYKKHLQHMIIFQETTILHKTITSVGV